MFSDLTSRFPTSDELFAWLRSAEGGKLTIRTNKMTPERPFALIHYDKETTDMTVGHVGQFRSVVWDANTNKPMCAGPVRGLSAEQAVADGVDPAAEGVVVEDFVDGVMINLFHNGRDWEVATRTQLGAEHHFYGTRSFRELFWETFAAAGLTKETLNTAISYSWVLQHPEERIVVAPEYGIARLFLVETTGEAEAEALAKFRPKRYTDLKSLQDLTERVEAWGKRFGAKWQGLVVKTADGKRYKFRTAEYNAAHHLRGNQAKRPYTWLERWGEGRLSEYLRLYPEERSDAEATVEAFKTCTQELFDLYQKVYRRRELPLGQAPQKYRKLLWDCHAANAGAYFPNTRKFMNEQDVARKLWLVNYARRYGGAVAAADATE